MKQAALLIEGMEDLKSDEPNTKEVEFEGEELAELDRAIEDAGQGLTIRRSPKEDGRCPAAIAVSFQISRVDFLAVLFWWALAS